MFWERTIRAAAFHTLLLNISSIAYSFFPTGLFFVIFLILAHLWWLGFWGWGLIFGFWGWGFQLIGFGASGVRPSGFFGLWLSI